MKFTAFLVALMTSTAALADDDGGMRAFLLSQNGAQYSTVPRQKRTPVSDRSYITRAALRHGLNPRLLHAIVRVESGGNCHAVSYAGAVGVGQVKPATARSVGVYGNLKNCETGIEAAARYLKLAVQKGGSGCAGIGLYERGVGATPRCTAYARKVMAQL